MEEESKVYKSPASISSEFLSDMISKLIEDSGIDEQEPKDLNNQFKEEHDDNDSAISPLDADIEDDDEDDEDDDEEGEEPIVSDITKSDTATKTPKGNPVGPATVGLVLLVPSSFSADVVKDAVIGERGREHRKLLGMTRCNHIRFKECTIPSLLEGFSCLVAFSHATEGGAKRASIRIAGSIAEAVEPLSRRELRRKMKLWSCDPETVASISFVLEEDLALRDVEDRQRGRFLYEFAVSRLASIRLSSRTKKSGIIISQRSPYDLSTKVFMSLIEFPATLRRRNACASALIGTNGSIKKRIEETSDCKLEIILDADTIGEPYVFVTANAREKAVAGVDAVIEIFRNVLRPKSEDPAPK